MEELSILILVSSSPTFVCLSNRGILVSIEDAYGCKRPITVPGLSVNVRRIKVNTKCIIAAFYVLKVSL